MGSLALSKGPLSPPQVPVMWACHHSKGHTTEAAWDLGWII